MTWYGWYSERQEKIFGYAHYQNKKGDVVAITKITQDPNYILHYKDSIFMGELTHFIGVKKWNCISRKYKEATDNIISTMKYDSSGPVFGPSKIIE